jgi:hypothetical protein
MKVNDIIKVDGHDVLISKITNKNNGEYSISCDPIGLKDKLLVKALAYIDSYAISLNREQRELLHEIDLIRKSCLPKK